MRKQVCALMAMILAAAVLTVPVSAAQEGNVPLTWKYNSWWFQETDTFFGTNNGNPGSKYAYAEQKLTGKQSFRYEVTLTADVTDDNVKNGGWESLEVYLAIDGEPDTNLDGFSYPGETNASGEKQYYDSLFVQVTRYPANTEAKATVWRVVKQQATELGGVILTEAQRVNGHTFQFVFDYAYSSDDNNVLTIRLDGQELLKQQNCQEMVCGAPGFLGTNLELRVTHASLTNTETVPPTSTNGADSTPDHTEKPTETGDFNSFPLTLLLVILSGCMVAGTIVLRQKKRG